MSVPTTVAAVRPHNRGGARITFTGRDIREISEMTAIRPLAEKKRRPARRAPAAA